MFRLDPMWRDVNGKTKFVDAIDLVKIFENFSYNVFCNKNEKFVFKIPTKSLILN